MVATQIPICRIVSDHEDRDIPSCRCRLNGYREFAEICPDTATGGDEDIMYYALPCLDQAQTVARRSHVAAALPGGTPQHPSVIHGG